jgi:hypothetical protein
MEKWKQNSPKGYVVLSGSNISGQLIFIQVHGNLCEINPRHKIVTR